MSEKEAKARIKINRLLEEAGWRFFDEDDNPANIQVEPSVKLTKSKFDSFGENFEKVGYIDFLLLDENGHPFIVLEAKSEEKDPLTGKEQARNYARSACCRYVILSNGNQHYFWDISRGNPQLVTSFPSYESLRDSKAMNADPARLYVEEVKEDYIAVIKNPQYADSPEYKNPETRKQFLIDNHLKMLRPYQLNAIKALQKSVMQGNQRFLFEMATGTGKTLTAAAVIKLFLRSANAHRVLFLVDRIELEDQANKNFIAYLGTDYITLLFKKTLDDWRKADIVVSTVQTLMFNNKYKRYFKPTDFSLLIVDESHRSIGGNNRALFEYFLGYKLGLTATPKDYLKNINEEELKSSDPRAWEKRQLLDSYKTFGCEAGDPTYRYSLIDGVKDGYLVNPVVVDARTDVTTKLLAEEGFEVIGEDDSEEKFFARDFERRFFSQETNKMLVKAFIDHAKRDPISGEVGKGIVFCVSRKHAAKITQLLNEYADIAFPNKYNSDFAMQITSDIMGTKGYSANFQNNNLRGTTKFLEGYKSSKTRICVTVGMMTTGYDCEDLLNIGLFRPIFSPTDFIQIKGRGTRKFTFKWGADKVEKDSFKLFDFFANCEYFEEKYPYDEILSLPKFIGKGDDKGEDFPPPPDIDSYVHGSSDKIKTIVETPIGAQGMRIDRMYFDKFEEQVKNDPTVHNQYEQGGINAVKYYIENNILEKPQDYFTWEKLKKAIGIDRNVGISEIIEKILGLLPGFKSKNELVEDEFDNFRATCAIDAEHFNEVRRFFEAYLTDKAVQRAIQDGAFQSLGTEIATYTMADLHKLGIDNMKKVVEYANDNVNLSRFVN